MLARVQVAVPRERPLSVGSLPTHLDSTSTYKRQNQEELATPSEQETSARTRTRPLELGRGFGSGATRDGSERPPTPGPDHHTAR